MNTMRFGLMRAALFMGLVLGGVLMHAGRVDAGEPGQALATSVRAEAVEAQRAIQGELATALRTEAQRRNAAALGTVAAALQAASTAAPVHGLVLAPAAYGAPTGL
jgi:hypothetical protein